MKEKLKALQKKLFGTKRAIIITTIGLLIFFSTLVYATTEIFTSSSNCGNARNLIRNCDFETPIDFERSWTGPDWRKTSIDATRQAWPGQYTNEVAQIETAGKGKVLQVGKETGTCSLPKTAGGGGSDLFRLYPEAGQYINVGNATNFHVSFDAHMKSRHTRLNSAPIYVWTALRNGGIEKGVESFLAFTPHDTAGEVCEETPFRTDLTCRVGVGGRETDCSSAINGWQRFEYNVDRNILCEGDIDCINNAQLFHIGFGVTNDYDTLFEVDNVVVTNPQLNGSITPTPIVATPTPSPTIRPTRTPTPIPTATPTPIAHTPTPTPIADSCSVVITKIDEANKNYNTVTLSFSGKGGMVRLQMLQKGTKTGSSLFAAGGFFSENSLKAFSNTDAVKKTSAATVLGPFTSDSILVKYSSLSSFIASEFKIYDWEKKYKKNPSVSDTSTNANDFIQTSDTGWWYFIDYCSPASNQNCSKDGVSVRLPKNKSSWFFCSVTDTSQTSFVCNGNPICSYNNGPDVGVGSSTGCLAWKRSCSTSDYTSFNPGTQGGLNLKTIIPENPLREWELPTPTPEEE